jgi:ATP-dependent phosphoenolpyruvate carboxykinase
VKTTETKTDAKAIQVKKHWKNPSCSDLREWARKDELTTEYGSASYITKVRNRSPKNTFIVDAGYPIGVRESIGVLREIARDTIPWERDRDWGYEVATNVPGIETEEFNPKSFYSPGEYDALVEKLRRERVEWLAQFPGLDSKIQKAVEKTA